MPPIATFKPRFRPQIPRSPPIGDGRRARIRGCRRHPESASDAPSLTNLAPISQRVGRKSLSKPRGLPWISALEPWPGACLWPDAISASPRLVRLGRLEITPVRVDSKASKTTLLKSSEPPTQTGFTQKKFYKYLSVFLTKGLPKVAKSCILIDVAERRFGYRFLFRQKESFEYGNQPYGLGQNCDQYQRCR